ncbi:MAG: PaaX family transcriptional regulator C-terminal domain-containing protein [Thalassobaculum sp.]|uniref:PaaX family transcriptional regulator C-terminal domain-containing protein n=1 Tax=Thalassobaculum sp. TaxID=2022740 RepID=UPI0032ED951A
MTDSPQPIATADLETQARALIAGYPARMPLRAAAFIVTLYGDVVVPRGGTLWIGNVIEACAEVGISETLVRTAVSRLVAAGRLVGTRAGRRSFYSLTPSARAEFERAADILYAGDRPPEPAEWTFVLAPGGEARPAVEALSKTGFGLAAAGVALRPGPPPPLAGDGPPPLVFRARLDNGRSAESLRALAASAWDLPGLAREYDGFVALFEPIAAALPDAPRLDSALALTARLLLVHAFRRTALRDPQLPPDALPGNWSGHAARRLFGSLYRALSPEADARVARRFVDGDGPIRAAPGSLQRRLRSLAQEGGR